MSLVPLNGWLNAMLTWRAVQPQQVTTKTHLERVAHSNTKSIA